MNTKQSWKSILAADLKANPASSNINGVLLSRPHGGYRLAKQTSWGDEYVVFAYSLNEAWERLASRTGWTVSELKSMQITEF